MKFVTSFLKTAIVLFWIAAGSVGLLAARHNTRLLDASKAELTAYQQSAEAELAQLRRQVNDATSELGQFRDQLSQSVANVEVYRLEAAKWKGRFDAICSKVSQIASESSEPVLSVVSE